MHNRAGQIAADISSKFAFDLETVPAIALSYLLDVDDTRHSFQCRQNFGTRALHFDGYSFPALQLQPKILRRVHGYDLAAVDDDDSMTGLLDLRQNVGREHHRVLAGQIFDQLANFMDLLRIEADRRLVENQHRRIIQQRLRYTDALFVAFR